MKVGEAGNRLDTVEDAVGEISDDVGEISDDVGDLKSDVNGIKIEQRNTNEGLSRLLDAVERLDERLDDAHWPR